MKRVMLCVFGILSWASLAIAQDVCAPSKITTVSVTAGRTTAYIEWTNSGDDCNTGTATTFEVYRSTSNITETNWGNATLAATGSPGANGTTSCVDNSGSLSCNTTYYWVVFLIDENNNRSPFGTVVQQATGSCNPFTQEVTCP